MDSKYAAVNDWGRVCVGKSWSNYPPTRGVHFFLSSCNISRPLTNTTIACPSLTKDAARGSPDSANVTATGLSYKTYFISTGGKTTPSCWRLLVKTWGGETLLIWED